MRSEIAPPQKIYTVKYKPWRAANFPILKALYQTIYNIFQERLDRGTLEYYNRLYYNPWFLIKKGIGANPVYRLINIAININRITIKDANLPFSPDAFTKEFAGI